MRELKEVINEEILLIIKYLYEVINEETVVIVRELKSDK